MKRPLLILSLMLSSIIAKSQLNAESLTIYKDFKGRGTTVNLWLWHHDADSLKISLQKVSDTDLNTINELFVDTKLKKYFQQKHGGQLLLGFVYINGQKYKCAISNYPNATHFVNLSDHKHLMLVDSVKVAKVNAILFKYSQ